MRCYCHKAKASKNGFPCLCKQWEATLAAEDLKPLDIERHDDTIIVSNKGAGKLKSEAASLNREEAAAAIEEAEAILSIYPFTRKKDRELWRMHSEGIGYQSAARKLAVSEKYVRTAIARIRTEGKALIRALNNDLTPSEGLALDSFLNDGKLPEDMDSEAFAILLKGRDG